MAAFAVGAVLMHQVSELPSAPWLVALAVGAAALPWPRARLPAAFCLGLLWTLGHASAALDRRLPAALEGRDLLLDGEIVAVDRVEPHYSRLMLRPTAVAAPAWRPRLVRLGWYGQVPAMLPGEHWRLHVRLKRPNGLMNPGGADYECWLFARGIDAVGYVRQPDRAQRLADGWSLNRLRHLLAERLAERLEGHPARGIVVALAVGERRWINDAQWEVLRTTGTAHLVAISGLHVGLVALLVGALAARLWRLSAAACRRCPARLPAVVAGMLAATMYALLAGFTLPTQRALIMLLVPAVALLVRRRIRAWHGCCTALAAVLLWDPLAPLSAGFWLSFGAVALLLAVGVDRSPVGWLRRGVEAQLAVSLGLLPVSVLWLQTAAWAAPLANAWAIPLVGFVVVPLTLIGAMLVAIAPDAGVLLDAAADLAALVLIGLRRVAGYAPTATAAAPAWAVALAVVAAFLLVLPRGLAARWLVVPLLLPLALAAPATTWEEEALRMTVLDVGQGLSVVLETEGEAMVYDTGPAGGSFDAGASVVVPYLQSRGYRAVRWLIVSHDDRDHSGGTGALVRRMDIDDVRVGEPVAVLGERSPCVDGERLRWQDVELEFLWPPRTGKNGNDSSCVLRIRAAGVDILLTGDIGASAERVLAQRRAEALRAGVVLVPHHGSGRSSTEAFVQAVSPRHALVSAGYRNGYGFPRPEVVARYRSVGADVRTTAEEGAIELRVMRDGALVIDGYRRRNARYYHRLPEL